jgi:hypothetical protein
MGAAARCAWNVWWGIEVSGSCMEEADWERLGKKPGGGGGNC